MSSRQVIQVAVKAGRHLNAFAGDSITVEIQKRGVYDGNTLASLRDVLGTIKPQTSLDIGANIGNHALVIAQYSAQLIAFEPVRFIYEVLYSNIGLNELRNVVALNLGLSNENSKRNIFIPENGNLGSSSLEAMNGDGDLVEILTVVGDDYLHEHYPDSRIDFIKIDVEGHEAPALTGLTRTIARDQPLLLIEWNSPNTIGAFAEHELFATLFPGYAFYSLSSTGNKKVHPRNAVGFLRRVAFRIFSRKWCLSSFTPEKHYSNVYLVPRRYQSAFSTFRYLTR